MGGQDRGFHIRTPTGRKRAAAGLGKNPSLTPYPAKEKVREV